MQQEPPLVIRLFGAFDIKVGGVSVASMCNRKLPSLVALLVLHEGRECKRLLLASSIWPDSLQEEALANLRVNLVALRKVMGKEKWRLTDPRGFLGMNLTDADIDIIAFDRAIRRNTTASLEEAVEIYSGELLAGNDDEWVGSYREKWEQVYHNALIALAETAVRDGDQDTAILRYRMATEVSPYYQIAHRQLMSLLGRLGRYAEALEVYHSLRKRLHKECSAQPEPATTERYNFIRDKVRHQGKTSSPTPAPPKGQGYFEVPRPMTPMIGRIKECNRIVSSLNASPLVTITGIGGIGKTRTAIHIAHEVQPTFHDGVLFSELETVADSSLIYQTLAKHLHLQVAHGQSWKEAVIDRLRYKRFLLILDNCEQLIEGCREVVKTLLDACGDLKIIVTSRERLGMKGEQVCVLPPFPVPANVRASTVADLILNPSVKLFLEHAVAVGETIEPTLENIQTIVRICRRVEGIPLAIELAASRLETLTLSTLDTGLKELFRLLVSEEPPIPLRQRGLKPLLDWSYRLLDEEGQEMLRNLSVFVGGCSVQAAQTVCCRRQISESDTESALNKLVRMSLVIVEKLDSGPRYSLLSIVHEYAREMLEADPDNRSLRDRHCKYYLSRAEEIALDHQSSQDQQNLSELELDYGNYRKALNWSLENEKDTSNGIGFSLALWRFWYSKGYLNEGVQWFEKAIACSASRGDARFATAQLRCGNLAYLAGQTDVAKQRFQQADELFEMLGNVGSSFKARASRGLLAIDACDFDVAEDLFSQSLAYFESVKDVNSQALVLANLAVVAKGKGNLDNAINLHQRSLELFRLSNDFRNITLGLNNLADALINQGDPKHAFEALCESYELSKQLGNQTDLLHCVINCCGLAQSCGLSDIAAEIFGISELIIESLPESAPPRALSELEECSNLIRKKLGRADFYRTKELGRNSSMDEVVTRLASLI